MSPDASAILTATAADLAERIRSGELTSEQVTSMFLDQIDAVDAQVNAFITVEEVSLKRIGRSTGAASSLTVAIPCSG